MRRQRNISQMKEQNKIPEEIELNKMETSNLTCIVQNSITCSCLYNHLYHYYYMPAMVPSRIQEKLSTESCFSEDKKEESLKSAHGLVSAYCLPFQRLYTTAISMYCN